jgi:hypothetical protein
MEHYFTVNVWRKRQLYHGSRKPKSPFTAWVRSHDSSYENWEGAVARVQSLKDFLRGEAGDFSDEQIITARGGSYNWSWRNGMNDCIIEITKIDFGRVYDWDDIGPDVE